MSAMIERVARALLEHQINTGQCDPDIQWQSFIGEARAAIASMREPTEAMIEAAWNAPGDQPQSHWRAMLDAAISEGK
jgi:hypothetical protein